MAVTEPTATNVIAGPAQMWIAPLGTTVPTLTAWPITFGTGWTQVGYTDTGVDFTYTPTLKSFTPDEEASPVYDILQAEKFEITATLAEATMQNYQYAVSLSTIGTAGTVTTVGVGFTGNAALNYIMLGVTGPAPFGPLTNSAHGRALIVQKAVAGSAIAYKMTRKDVVKYAVKFEARKLAGQQLYDLYEFAAAS